MIDVLESCVEIKLAHGGYIVMLRGLTEQTEVNGIALEQSDERLHVTLTLEAAMTLAERHIKLVEAEWAQSVDAEPCDEPPPDEQAHVAG